LADQLDEGAVEARPTGLNRQGLYYSQGGSATAQGISGKDLRAHSRCRPPAARRAPGNRLCPGRPPSAQ